MASEQPLVATSVYCDSIIRMCVFGIPCVLNASINVCPSAVELSFTGRTFEVVSKVILGTHSSLDISAPWIQFQPRMAKFKH